MKLVSNEALLSPIVNELLNILYTKLARVISTSGFHPRRRFCSSFDPSRIMEDEAGVIWVRYLKLDPAHPTLDFGE